MFGVGADGDGVVPDGFVWWLGAFVFGPFLLWFGVFLFTVCAAIYILGWKERLGPRAASYVRPLQRSSVFAATILVLCALAIGLTKSTPAWTAALVALESLVFVWSFTRFRHEFGQT
jgi:hypothetical protein